MSTPLYSVCSMNFRYVLPHFEEAQYLMGTMLLSGQGERAFQIGCLRSCRFGGVGLLPGCLEKLPGVEQNMAWAAHWFEQAGIRRTILPSARCSHRRDPAIGHQAALQGHVDAQYNLGLMRLAAVVVNVTSRDSLGRTFPLFCSNVYLPVLAFCWILVGYAMIVPSFFQKASERQKQ